MFEPERMVVWNCDPVVSRRAVSRIYVATNLVHPRVLPFSTQELGEVRTEDVARNLHATRRTSWRTR